MKNYFFSFLLLFPALLVAQVIPSDYIYPAEINLFDLASSDIEGKSPSIVNSENLRHIKSFTSINPDKLNHKSHLRDAAFAKFLSPQDALSIVKDAENHPVVSTWKTSKYDPESRGIGYCFGRAMFIHLDLYYRGFDRDSIRKAFVVGPMTTAGGGSWGWHVTTIAQSLDEEGRRVWLALDPIYTHNSKGQTPTLEEWYQKMHNQYSSDKKLKLYITEAGKFAASSHPYDTNSMKHPSYHDYFQHLMSWLIKESQEGHYRLKKIEDYKVLQCRSLF